MIKPRLAAAIVGHADLLLGDAVATVLEAHIAASPQRFRGIRHSATWDPSNAWRSETPQRRLAIASSDRALPDWKSCDSVLMGGFIIHS